MTLTEEEMNKIQQYLRQLFWNPDITLRPSSSKDGPAEVYIGNGVMFHDRRVPGDDSWGTQSLGNYPVWEGSQALAEALGLKMGKVTTGSSLDMQPCDLEIIQKHGGALKDMEGAAVGFVCSLFKTPILYVKSVTDLCDSGAETFEEFSRNLHKACEALRAVNEKVIAYLTENR